MPKDNKSLESKLIKKRDELRQIKQSKKYETAPTTVTQMERGFRPYHPKNDRVKKDENSTNYIKKQ